MPTWLLSALLDPKVWVGLAFAAVLAFGGVQTGRLNHAKGDLASARAALIDPATKKTWRDEAVKAADDLASCHISLSSANAALGHADAATAALKAESDRRTADAASRLAAADKAALAGQRRITAVLAAKAGADACKSADALILGSVQ
ncbi:MAG: hypothetical protein P4L73_19755 [Caulobacteraceae bacterium]|nr:hypothetical protein [Caulobacteraceae bacterium]